MSSSLRLPAAALRFRRLPTGPSMALRRGMSSGAPEYTGVPLSYANKAALKWKFLAFCGGGFSIPFVASWWQLRKGTPNAS